MRKFSKEFEHPIPLFLFRSGALFFLYLHSVLYFRESLSIIFVLVAFPFSLGVAAVLHASRIRIVPAIAFMAILPWIFQFAVISLFGFFGGGPNFLFWDTHALDFERNFILTIVPWIFSATATLLFFRFRRYAAGEAGIFGLIAVAVFWTQGGFQIGLYGHPLSFAIALCIFLVLESFSIVFAASLARASGTAGTSSGTSSGTEEKKFEITRSRRLMVKCLATFPVIFLVGLLLFWIFGRYSDASVTAGGGLLKPSMFRFDFSNYLNLESEIRMNRDMVLLYRRNEQVDRYLLRRHVLEGYKPDRMFFQDPEGPGKDPPEIVPEKQLYFSQRETLGRVEVSQELYILNLDASALVSLDYPTAVIPYQTWKDSSFIRVYRVDAMACGIYPFELSDITDSGMVPDMLEYYTRYGDDPKIRELAEEITEGLPGYYDRVQTIHDYLKYEFFYSLKPGLAPDGNQLHHFLFQERRGYCSYFAFAMTLMCRSLGIPARVAVGFFINPEDEILGFYPVRSDMAHAWVEVYFDDFGWIDFDPTSQTAAPGEDIPGDSKMDKVEITSLLEEILNRRLEPAGEDLNLISPVSEEVFGSRRFFLILTSLQPFGRIILPILLILATTAARMRFLILYRITREPRRRTMQYFAFLLQEMRGRGHIWGRRQTLSEYVCQIALETGLPLEKPLRLFQKSRYAEHFNTEDFTEFETAIRKYRKDLRASLPIQHRFTGYINPSSFRSRL